jgi:hypothetical protein
MLSMLICVAFIIFSHHANRLLERVCAFYLFEYPYAIGISSVKVP